MAKRCRMVVAAKCGGFLASVYTGVTVEGVWKDGYFVADQVMTAGKRFSRISPYYLAPQDVVAARRKRTP